MSNTRPTSSRTQTLAALWQQLTDEHLVSGALPTLPAFASPTPLLGRLLLGFLGWLSGLFLLIALGGPLYAVFNWQASLWGIGALLLLGAWWMYKTAKHADFVEHFALSLSTAGQFSLVFAFVTTFDGSLARMSTIAVCIFTITMHAILFALIANKTHRTLCAAFAFCAVAVLLYEAKIAFVLPPALAAVASVIWIRESKWLSTQIDDHTRPIGNAAWAMLLIACASSFSQRFGIERWTTHGASVGLAIVLLAITAHLTRRASTNARLLSYLAALVFAAASYAAPGLIACAIAFILAFDRGHRAASALALLFAATYLVAYYYQTATTLLQKSVSLAIIAAVLAIFSFVASRVSSNGGRSK